MSTPTDDLLKIFNRKEYSIRSCDRWPYCVRMKGTFTKNPWPSWS